MLFGRDYTGKVSLQGDNGNNSLIGTAANETIVGGRGNDTLDGGAGSDVLIGGAGNDVIVRDALDRHVRGGTGNDVLSISGSQVTLDFTAIPQNKLTGIDVLNITGVGANRVKLTLQDLIDMSDHASLRIDGNAGDTVQMTTTGWTEGAHHTFGRHAYVSFTHGGATLLVDTDVAVVIS